MPRRSSVRGAADRFTKEIDEVRGFVSAVEASSVTTGHVSLAYDAAIVRAHAAFEDFMKSALVGAINNDPTNTVAQSAGFSFPRQLSAEVCEYLVVGNGYFDFRGRSGLIEVLKKFLPPSHYLVSAVSDSRFRDPLNQFVALRNFAAHNSPKSRAAALNATSQTRMASAGSWLKVQGRFERLMAHLKDLADQVRGDAPY